ncbi:RNA-splicing ligase protein [Rhizobium phage RHph_TM61]|nr:RNA-splicing ligase protein [Rhizobium phage RHph_TM61]
MDKITGDTLIQMGYFPGSWFKKTIEAADNMLKAGWTMEMIEQYIGECAPKATPVIPAQMAGDVPIFFNIDAETDYEIDNLAQVMKHMDEIARIPTIRALSVMPDACPSGKELGTIPVGGVAVAHNAIHPGMHSNDVCCSVAISVFPSETDPTSILDAGMVISHFGPGGRTYSNDMQVSSDLLARFESNRYLKMLTGIAQKHMATQGDGNHFFYVGRLQSTGQVALVTHHGSRGVGAALYKLGIEAAHKQTQERAPWMSKLNSWLDADSEEGEEYWEALQIVRLWTKKNHFNIHDAVAKAVNAKLKDRYWNEHNFVFKRGDMFYHAKGSTPNYTGFAPEYSDKCLIPLSMGDPILITKVHDDEWYGEAPQSPSLGFCPHGAGRNMSRTQFQKELIEKNISPKDLIKQMTDNYDIRAYSGKYDISEFPMAYKNANQIIESIKKYNLTTIVDQVIPYGSIMAGHSSYSKR